MTPDEGSTRATRLHWEQIHHETRADQVSWYQAKARLGSQAQQIQWVVADVLRHDLGGPFDLWHDRAMFHFLTAAEDRQQYVDQLRRFLVPGGHAVLATFADDGPTRRSGLPVMRYHPAALARELGGDLELLESRRVTHRTPGGKEQRFGCCLFRRRPSP